jgi:hypothetical protein
MSAARRLSENHTKNIKIVGMFGKWIFFGFFWLKYKEKLNFWQEELRKIYDLFPKCSQKEGTNNCPHSSIMVE